jgi:hypothetical protein
MAIRIFAAATILFGVTMIAHGASPTARPRASDLGLKIGILPAGRSMPLPMSQASKSDPRQSFATTTSAPE